MDSRRVLISAILLALGGFCAQAKAALVIDTATYGGHTYYLLEPNAGTRWWLDNEQEAIGLGGHLVTINDAAEDDFVNDTFRPFAVAYASEHNLTQGLSLFIGYSDYAIEGNWVWASGEPTTYTRWLDSQPVTYPDNTEDFAGMTDFGYWHDIFSSPGADLTFAVVEVAVPEPASLTLWGLGALGCAVAGYRRRKLA